MTFSYAVRSCHDRRCGSNVRRHSELSYEKILNELSANDLKVLRALITISEKDQNESVKVEDVRNLIKMTSDNFTRYRTRLIDSGIVDGSRFGYLSIKLPYFKEFMYGTADYESLAW